MPAIDFPSSPTTNQTYTFNGRTWTYNGTAWVVTLTSPTASGLSNDSELYFFSQT